VGAYRARDFLLGPTLLSFTRVPLAVLFPFVVDRPLAATIVLALAGATDVLDGWWARRAGLVTPAGAVVDPIADKLFVITVVVTLVVTGHLAPLSVAWMSTRELGELPLVIWLLVSHAARSKRTETPRANLLGKLATTLQFATVGCSLWRRPETGVLIVITAVAGIVAAISYWRSALGSGVGTARDDAVE
jgi:CDP-diacylglycerol--glycerol-3-phosphate 3-phosphatidyltransferase